MKAILLAGFIVSLFLVFTGNDLFGAAPKKNSQAKVQQGKNSDSNKQNAKGKNSQKQKEKSGRATGQATARDKPTAKQLAYRIAFSKVPKGARVADTNFTSGPAPKGAFTETCSLRWILGEQQVKALEQQRKQAAEQKRKQEEAAAKRTKELQADKKRRNGLRLADFKKDLQKSASSIEEMERRLQPIRRKHKSLNEAITLTTSKAEGGNLPVVKTQLERMKRELSTHAEVTSGLADDLSSVKASCSKWNKSGSGGKEGAPSSSALSKLEETTLQIKRDCSRVEFELRKTETYHKTATKTLFFCVSELVRAGIAFTSVEKDSIRALSD